MPPGSRVSSLGIAHCSVEAIDPRWAGISRNRCGSWSRARRLAAHPARRHLQSTFIWRGVERRGKSTMMTVTQIRGDRMNFAVMCRFEFAVSISARYSNRKPISNLHYSRLVRIAPSLGLTLAGRLRCLSAPILRLRRFGNLRNETIRVCFYFASSPMQSWARATKARNRTAA